jgi:beta-mannosidase
MTTIDLSGTWEVERVGGGPKVVATVPGQIQMDLLRAGEIEDPYYRDRESEYAWIGESTWEYRRSFEVSKEALTERSVRLVCEGMDTVCEISINGAEVGRTDNMFRRYVFDVKAALREGANSISVRFHPPMEYAAKRAHEHPYPVPYSNMGKPDHHNFVRKSGTHFGWDWGPYMYAVGIWRPIRIEAFSEARIVSAACSQTHDGSGDVAIRVKVHLEAAGEASGTLRAEVAGAAGERNISLQRGENAVELAMSVNAPELWWPTGYGGQKLYDVAVSFCGAGGQTDGLTTRVGFRALELVREPDEKGESFFFRVNGVPIYAKGANWIPADSYDERVTRDSLANLLESARDANMNMIRVWGGGIYESDAFYELCDELGLMVWQDFMFACSLYPADDEFLANVEAEARHQVRRIRSHPCLALWCGNNENEQALSWYNEAKQNHDRYLLDYHKLYIETLGRVVGEEDPDRTYWPSSPSNGVGEWGDPQDQTRGDVHYWAVWHGGQPFSNYLTVCPRFSSEFGFQSFPSVESLQDVLGPDDWNVTAHMMEYRQRSGTGNLNMIQHISRWFRMPEGFDNFVYVSQALQALSLKTGIEHWRRLKPLCMGAIYWQINDIWQGPSWSSIEYDGRWKMLHYAARHFFAPVLVSAYEDGGVLQVWATSDLQRGLEGEVEAALWSWEGRCLDTWRDAVSLDVLGSKPVWSMPVDTMLPPGGHRRDHFVVLTLRYGDERVENLHFLAPPKHAPLRPVNIRVEASAASPREIAIELESDCVAPFTFLSTKARGRFDDNGFLLLPAQPKHVVFHAWQDVDMDEFRSALSVKSLRDSYA